LAAYWTPSRYRSPIFLKVPERGSVTPSLIVSAAWPEIGNEANRMIAKIIGNIEDIFFIVIPSLSFLFELNTPSLYL
jgi:hypothetical protein